MASDSSRRAGRPPSTDTAMTRSAAGQNHRSRAVGTDLAHLHRSWRKHLYTHECRGKRGRPLQIRQGHPRRKSHRKYRRRRRISGIHSWISRNRKVLLQWVYGTRPNLTLGKWVVHAAIHWQVHEGLNDGLHQLWLRWRQPTQTEADEPSQPNSQTLFIHTEGRARPTTTASAVRSKFGWPGPKSGLRALIILAQSMLLTEGVRVPASAGAGGPKPTEDIGVRQKGKHAPGGRTAPVMQTAGVMVNTGRKRSFMRAQNRSQQHPQGYARYRGQYLHCSQLGLHTARDTIPTPRATRRPAYKRRGGTAQRIKVLSINVNSLSGFLWGEIKTFLRGDGLQYDFIFLQETHRASFSTFQIDKWMAVGSSTKRGEGVLTLVHPKYDPSLVRYQEIIPGRVLRVKVCHAEAAIETLNIYQHVWIHNDEPEVNRQRRQNLLDRCSGVLQGMARRDTLILAGDFNAEVHCTPGSVGPCINKSEYHLALDPHSLTRFVQANELVVLNTWTMKDPCTNYTRTGNSQIDFVMVKPASADQRAKQVKKTEAPFGGWKEMTHNALVAEVRFVRHFHLPRATTLQAPSCSTKDLDNAYRKHDPRIQELQQSVQTALQQGGWRTVEDINHILLHKVSALFPAATKGRTGNSQRQAQCKAIFHAWRETLTHPDGEGGTTPALPTQVYHMWQRRKDLEKCKPFSGLGIIRTWKWIVLFLQNGRRSKQYHQQQQKAITLGHLQQAERAAQSHNIKRLYGAVKRLMPWKHKPRIMFRHPDGSPMSLLQEHKALVKHCEQLFAPAVEVPARAGR